MASFALICIKWNIQLSIIYIEVNLDIMVPGSCERTFVYTLNPQSPTLEHYSVMSRPADRVSAHRKSALLMHSALVKVHTPDVAHSEIRDDSGRLCVCSDTYKIRRHLALDS